MWIYDYTSEKDNPYKEAPFVKITHMCYVDNLPVWTYPWHVHIDSYEVGYVVEGSGILTVGNQNLPVSAGSVTVVPPNVMHHFTSTAEDGMRYYTLRFLAEDNNNDLQCFFRGLDNAATEAQNHISYIKSCFDVLFNLHMNNGGFVDDTFQSICLSLLKLTKQLFSTKALSVRLNEDHSAFDILKYIEQHNSEKITLESLAKRFNVSPSHMNRIFKNAYHMSPINYLIYSRVTYATEYLLKTNMTVAEISERVGYDNPAHFTNLFASRIGCTPTEYRERNMKIPNVDHLPLFEDSKEAQ